MHLEVRRLLLLADVHEYGSFTAAAQQAGYTTSAVSQQMAKLEAEAGQPLLFRGPQGTQLTEAGHVLVAHARRIRTELHHAEDKLEDIAELRAGRVRLGTFPTAAAFLIPPVFRTFRRLYPTLSIAVTSSRIGGLIEMLLAREIELAPMWEYEGTTLSPDEFEIIPLFDDPTLLLVPATHSLGHGGVRSFSALAEESWITRGDHPVTDVLVQTCHGAGFQPRVTYEAHDYQEAQAMVAVGVGLALAPRMALTSLRDDIVVVDVSSIVPQRRVVLVHRRGEHLAPAAVAMVDVFVSVAAELSASLRVW